MSRAELVNLKTLIGSADAGGYTLPAELVDAYATYTGVSSITLDGANPFSFDQAAAQLVASLRSGSSANLVDLARQFDQSTTDRRVFGYAQSILGQAAEQASNAATLCASDLTERIITEHLRPAFEDVLEQARAAAAGLAGHSLDPGSLLAAPAKVRSAYLALAPLVTRRAAIYQARSAVNHLGHREPQHDQQGLFALFRHPMVFHPSWSAPAQIPRLPIPDDPTLALLWIVSDATAIAADPWLPTFAEQDAAWWSQFGEQQQARVNAAQFARGFANH